MAAPWVTYIETRAGQVMAVRKIKGRAPAAPGRFVIRKPAQLALLESAPLRRLKWSGLNVLPKTAGELATMRQAEREAIDVAHLQDDRRVARLEVLLDEVNGLRAQHGSPPRTLADVRQAFQAKLAARRNP